jgi:UDP-N-acetyl-D-mannosaminuronate dehydrogenase
MIRTVRKVSERKKTQDLAQAAKKANCVVIVTDHKAFRQMELGNGVFNERKSGNC